MDFGQAYGHLRIIQKGNLLGFLTMLEVRRQEDEAMRQYATQPTSIDDAAIPPRRVWDLYSNRVLPFYAINEESVQAIAVNLWTVSHSWVINDARQLLWTPINSREWPVPIPRDTTLEHVRVELLNLGAEYAWLDVLCLRQYRGQEHELSRVGPENIERALQAQEWVRCEQLRADEWRLDVPTIGSVYSVQLPCVTYFNGLGLPFDPSPALLSSDRHWLNRVWTLQEGSDEWILGGATGASSADARDFFASHALPALRHRLTEHSAVWAEDMRRRHCTTELDRVHGLAYIFKCGTMPVYDEGVAPEDAWAMLLQHIPGTARRDLAARHVQHSPNDTTLFPSWTQFLRWTLPGDMAPGRHGIELVGTNRSGAPYPVFYSDIGVDYWGPFHIARLDCGSSNNSDELIELRAPDKSHEPYRMTGRVGNALSEGMPYVLVEIHAEAGVWIVAEVKKERKTFLGRPALDLVKRGGLLVSGKLRVPLPNGPKFATAVYRCDNPEVQETS
ncbi:hypothetical protein PsYK624_137340 [Phanerochaete sordida]|uniref:Heterokaryon incompatibility domain-containing protein n=1 Tax=Phanerochaete sordida TaxID=48140 RepID=A0A9P3LJM4_9APHY|nr:hypothetical protein PsYK624_137340 [Phanerochaete sordida]